MAVRIPPTNAAGYEFVSKRPILMIDALAITLATEADNTIEEKVTPNSLKNNAWVQNAMGPYAI